MRQLVVAHPLPVRKQLLDTRPPADAARHGRAGTAACLQVELTEYSYILCIDYNSYELYKMRITAKGSERKMTIQDTKQAQTTQMPTFTATEARNKFSDIFNQAHYGGGVLIEKHGKRVAVVPLEILDRLAELEALIDSADAQRALDEFHQMGGTSLNDLEKELEGD